MPAWIPKYVPKSWPSVHGFEEQKKERWKGIGKQKPGWLIYSHFSKGNNIDVTTSS